MNWETIILTVLPQLLALGGLGTWQWLYTRKVQRRLEEANAHLAEVQAQRAEVDTDSELYHRLEEQIDSLLRRIDSQDAKYEEQTQRLRDTQDRELAANQRAIDLGVKLAESEARVAKLEKEVGELKLKLKDFTCKKLTCIDRQPQNEYTKRAIKEMEQKAAKPRRKACVKAEQECSDYVEKTVETADE